MLVQEDSWNLLIKKIDQRRNGQLPCQGWYAGLETSRSTGSRGPSTGQALPEASYVS